jgi:hypothetical protein
MNVRPQTYNWRTSRAAALNTRKSNMMTLPNSQRTRRHILKIGNSVKHRTTGVVTVIETKEQKKTIKRDPDQVYFPNLNLGDQVIHESEMWMIIDIQGNDYTIQHPMTSMLKTVEANDLVKAEFT